MHFISLSKSNSVAMLHFVLPCFVLVFINPLTFVFLLLFSFSIFCVVNIKYLGKIKRKMRYCRAKQHRKITMFVFLVAFTLHFVLLCKKMSSALICLSTFFSPSWQKYFRIFSFFSVNRETCEWVEWTVIFLMFAIAEVSFNISFNSNLQIQAVRPISSWVIIDYNCGLRVFSLHSTVSIFHPYKSLWFLSIINPRINYNPIQWFRNMDYFFSHSSFCFVAFGGFICSVVDMNHLSVFHFCFLEAIFPSEIFLCVI